MENWDTEDLIVIKGAPTPTPGGERPLVGFLAVGMACCTSGFASVFFEYKLKKAKLDPKKEGAAPAPTSVWV